MTVLGINISKCDPKLKRRSLVPFARLSQWIKAQAHTANKEYTNAAQTFKLLDTKVSRSKLGPGVFITSAALILLQHHENCCKSGFNYMNIVYWHVYYACRVCYVTI